MAAEYDRNTLQDNASLVAAINDELQKIETAFEDVVSRSGHSPNAMEDTLDLGSQDIINVGTVSVDELLVDGGYVPSLQDIIDTYEDTEEARDAAIAARGAAETAQEASETARDAAQDAQSGAEAAQVASESARDDAQTAQTAAETAQAAAESAESSASDDAASAEQSATDAQSAQTAAEVAQAAAETAESNAESSASAASTSETNAADSETSAATSESNASDSASAAATSESNASSSETNAASSETNAEAAEQGAMDARDEAQDIVDNFYLPLEVTGDLTLSDTHNKRILYVTSETTITLPEDSTEDLPAGFAVDVQKGTTDTVDFSSEGTDVIQSPGGEEILTQYSWASVVKLESGVWALVGDV